MCFVKVMNVCLRVLPQIFHPHSDEAAPHKGFSWS